MTVDASNETSWSQFWASGSLTAFYGKTENYDAEFIAFWRTVLSEPVAQIIDLGCGNGALTWIADEILNHPEPTTAICGIDLAVIDPFATLDKNRSDHPNVSFLGECSIEAMPLETDSVDLAISQYGIEYAMTERVLPELGRVLKPKAGLAFILHDEMSSVLTTMKNTAEGIEFLLMSGGYYDVMLRMDKIQNKRKTIQKLQADPKFHKSVLSLRQITQSIERFPPPLKAFLKKHIAGTNRLFAKGQPIQATKRSQLIQQRRRLLEGTLKRYNELKQAALSREQYDKLIKQVEKEGFSLVEKGNFLHEADTSTTLNLGWKLVAKR
ncbi:MAG: class I SAM-dependent methyltransferase [Gammaproteobacteria bacterium]